LNDRFESYIEEKERVNEEKALLGTEPVDPNLPPKIV
jgi:hypothetical protein